MEIEENVKDRMITFYLRRDEVELMNNLSFVHLVMMKYDGGEEACESFHYPGNDEYIKITVSFPDWSASSNAMAHCKQNVSSTGNVKKSYKGALPKADPSGFMAGFLLEKALENKRR
ncbi:hypothetical protein [Marinimicrobium alkaliphilum]|uniref:hypothetical protein n=1 Tax=Marinimicrobium alkaliphilum TaxID=2202654 RepID=UPI000DBA8376|nr:hypothetical protein [Marinimicrobium alkaliphilum]